MTLAVSPCACEVTTLPPSALLTFQSSQEGLVSEWLLQCALCAGYLGIGVSKASEATEGTEESKAPLITSSLLSGEESPSNRVRRSPLGRPQGDAVFPRSVNCVSHSALAGILVAQCGDTASHRPGPGSHVHVGEVKME